MSKNRQQLLLWIVILIVTLIACGDSGETKSSGACFDVINGELVKVTCGTSTNDTAYTITTGE